MAASLCSPQGKRCDLNGNPLLMLQNLKSDGNSPALLFLRTIFVVAAEIHLKFPIRFEQERV